uniref:Ig-like domain-containing protein n=1 Tax=Myripristis murdjan TaxID=586833 RepID=A0A667WZ30_9TELE
MLMVFCMLSVLRIGRKYCTARVGEDVTLSCMRWNKLKQTTLFWIRLVAGNFPEVLGGTFSFDSDRVTKTRGITAKQEPGKFVLHITKTKLSDTAVYYCIKVEQLRMTFLNGTFLRITEMAQNILLSLLSTVLAICLIVIAFLIYTIKTKTPSHCDGIYTSFSCFAV